MKAWRQTRLYSCLLCGMQYRHDDAHHHVLHQCEQRPAAKLDQWLAGGRVYSPATERDRA